MMRLTILAVLLAITACGQNPDSSTATGTPVGLDDQAYLATPEPHAWEITRIDDDPVHGTTLLASQPGSLDWATLKIRKRGSEEIRMWVEGAILKNERRVWVKVDGFEAIEASNTSSENGYVIFSEKDGKALLGQLDSGAASMMVRAPTINGNTADITFDLRNTDALLTK